MKRRRISTTHCTHCGNALRRYGVTTLCLDCRELATKHASKAARQTHRAIIRGELAPVSSCMCVDCGAQATIYDHRDYDRPLDVEPVCHGCNVRRGSAMPYIRLLKAAAA